MSKTNPNTTTVYIRNENLKTWKDLKKQKGAFLNYCLEQKELIDSFINKHK